MMQQIKHIVEELQYGNVVCLPTETVYGLAVDASNLDAITKLYQLKGMKKDKPTSVAIGNPDDILDLVDPISLTNDVRSIIDKFWPGPLTIILKANAQVSYAIHRGSNKVGVRCPDHAIIQEIIQTLGHPLCLTSANLAGGVDGITAAQIKTTFGDQLYILEGDLDVGGVPSTIIDMTELPYKIVRKGTIQWSDIQKIIDAPEIF